jgi:hypothetical protein
VYLDTGINLLDVEEQFTSNNHSTCSRIYLWLAKLRLACGSIEGAKAACDVLLRQAKTLKDRVLVTQVFIQVLLVEGSRQDALDEALSLLELMGESFPKSGISVVVDRELEQLRSSDRQKDNTVLLRPQRVTDKKTLDVFVSNMLGESESRFYFSGTNWKMRQKDSRRARSTGQCSRN